MRKYAVQVITILTGLLGAVLLFQPSTASAGQAPPGGGCGYNCGTTTTKVTYPTTTTKPYETTTTYPHQTTTTKPQETTTTYPHQTTTTQPHETTTTQPEQTTTTMEQTTTTQPMETTTTQPEETTTTQPEETTTTNPNLTILSLRAVVIGGPATPADFDLFASGPIDINGITDSPNVTFRVVDPGFYALSFVADALANDPYTNDGWDCVGSADTTTESVTLDAGEDALCVITFTEAAAVTTTTTPVSTTLPGATTTTIAPTGTTVAPTGTTLPPGQTTPGGPGTTTPVEVITPETAVPALVTPASASGTLPFTGSDTRLGLGSGLLLVMAGGVIVLLTRRFKRS